MNGAVHRPVLVIQHAPWETPGLIDVALGELPTVRRMVLDDPGAVLPPVSELGGVVVMGGPQDADDDERHPGLALERRTLAAAVSADVPVLGVCLGMQLLALALGARLHRRHGVEIGFAPVELTGDGVADPVLGALASVSRAPVVLHWHSDAVELPAGATLLGSTSSTPVQAFRTGSALGTQFHPEADRALLAGWLATPPMSAELGPAAVERLRRDGDRYLPGLLAPALRGLDRFAAAIRDRRG